MSIELELRKIKERAEKATEGPWVYDVGNLEVESHADKFYRHVVVHVKNDLGDRIKEGRCHYDVDAEFIAHARTDIPKLLRVIERLEAQRNHFILRNCASDSEFRHLIYIKNLELEGIINAT
jgi:hypothetical protein